MSPLDQTSPLSFEPVILTPPWRQFLRLGQHTVMVYQPSGKYWNQGALLNKSLTSLNTCLYFDLQEPLDNSLDLGSLTALDFYELKPDSSEAGPFWGHTLTLPLFIILQVCRASAMIPLIMTFFATFTSSSTFYIRICPRCRAIRGSDCSSLYLWPCQRGRKMSF